MWETLLWLCAASLALSSLTSLADASPLQVLSAPNVLRVGSPENIFVECQDCTGGEQNVQIIVTDYTNKSRLLTSTAVTINSANNFQAMGQITIPSGTFKKDPNLKQFVFLQAQFPGRLLEKVVLVSFQSGYIFIQTDKTIYTPDTRVNFRVFGVNPGMVPIERDWNDANDDHPERISIEIVTPDGIVLPVGTVALRSGLHSGRYDLPEIVSVGVWKVVARFQNIPQESFSADFEVKEYVLPSFEVNLIPDNSLFYVDNDQLHIYIRAMYQSGKEVEGTAYVVFGVVYQDEKKSFPPSLQRVPVVRGEGKAILLRRHITDVFPDIIDLVKSHIFVSVSVLTESGSEMVKAELKGIQIVTSPYTIHFKKTPKYFKPGMSFDVSVVVLNSDDSLAVGVPIRVGPGDLLVRTAGNGMATVTVSTVAGASHLDITAKTADRALRDDRQASAVHRAPRYTSRSNSYLHIDVGSSELRLGDNLEVNLHLPRHAEPNQDITYLILSRGQLIKNARFKRRGQSLVTLSLVITKDMIPSFRIIAYYHTGTNEVVSDSVWVDVKDSCMGSLRIESARDVTSFQPRKKFALKVTGDPEATVGLVAVDESIYVLNNKHRLTQKKVWDLVEKYDTGCTAGGGKDSMGVFSDAGLLFMTSAEDGTPYRQELRCPGSGSARRKRGTLGEEDDYDDGYEDSDWIITRTHFPESWLWRDVQLPRCDRSSPNCETTSIVRNEPLPDSITTWIVTGISLSKTHGICVADPLAVVVQKPFFIDLRLPYSAVRGEQLEIKAILNNNSPDENIVRVELFDTSEHLCSAASKRGKYRLPEVTLGPYTTRSVPFIIVPMKDGRYPIEVKAQVRHSYLSDGIRKLLRVVPEGELVKDSKHVTLDPAKHNGRQLLVINSGIPTADVVLNTPSSTLISITGGQQMGVFVEEAISGDSMGSLIRQPAGNGEQNMILMTLPVIATTYLDKTNKWEDVGLNKRNEALQHIRRGYENQLSYRQSSGCFSVFNNRACSTWLTAYVVKVFAMTSKMQVPVQDNVICDAVKWLILNTQQSNGVFIEIGQVIHREMQGNIHGTDSDASMTAFVLIAMQEARRVCHGKVNSMAGSIDRAVEYLERNMPRLTNPYAVAMTSYALANEDRFSEERKHFLYTFVSDLSHWPVPTGHVYTLEATAYALLALVKAQAFEEAGPIVRWFNKQQKTGGGYGSTQATMMVYQAVSEYWADANEMDYDLDVEILVPGRAKPNRYNINRDNSHLTRTSRIDGVNHDLTVTATGRGEATLTVVSHYYVLPRERKSDCERFNLSVELIPEKTVGEEKTYKMKILVLFKDRQSDSGMAVLNIGLLTGFTVNSNDLDLLSGGVDRVISKYEMNTVLSERGSLIIYLDKVSRLRPDEIVFRVTQTMRVGNLQPAAVSVYEYYDEKRCVKFYHPVRQEGELLTLCRKNDSECTCAEGAYPMTDSTAPPLSTAAPPLLTAEPPLLTAKPPLLTARPAVEESGGVRLVGGISNCTGTLEVKYQGEWRPATDLTTELNLTSSSVVCRQLGCGSAVDTKWTSGSERKPVWMMTSSCNGFETSLGECVTMQSGRSVETQEVICSALFSQCGRAHHADVKKVRGGRGSVAGTHPWQVSLQRRTKGSSEPFRHYCGGVLIASCWVLTAAHCIGSRSKEMQVVLGGVYLMNKEVFDQFLPVGRAIVHPDYRESKTPDGRLIALRNDVALLELNVTKAPLCAMETFYVKTACLPNQLFSDGEECVVSGWGRTREGNKKRTNRLLEARVPLISKRNCTAPDVYGDRLDDTMICAGHMEGGVDACQGDSGGPLMCEQDGTHYIAGLVSWGPQCVQSDKPGVYTNVHRFVAWIREKMSNVDVDYSYDDITDNVDADYSYDNITYY